MLLSVDSQDTGSEVLFIYRMHMSWHAEEDFWLAEDEVDELATREHA